MSYEDWREPMTGAFSCEYKPGDFSCENGVLFSAEACMLGLITVDSLHDIVGQYELIRGALLRHPTSKDLCSWDDHFGASVASEILAVRVRSHMEANGWKLPNGNWLGRIPIFKPAVRAGAGLSLSLWDQIKTAATYFHNTFERRSETSGKLMLMFGMRVFQAHWLTRKATAYWVRKMSKLYASPREMVHIYFPDKEGQEHPFVTASKRSW